MKTYGICPICDGPTDKTSYQDEGRIYEEEAICNDPKCTYHYSFAYGHTLEVIGSRIFEWSYQDETPYTEIDDAIKTEKHKRGLS